MSITSITHLRDCGIFRDFTWANDLPEFGQYNLIYGWNGTGKTTISRIFRALEMIKKPDICQVTIKIDKVDVKGEDFPKRSLPIRVFNRDFISENVFRVDGKDLPGIFIIGRENIEKQEELEKLKNDLGKEQKLFVDVQTRKQNASRGFDSFCIDHARLIKNTLLSPGQNPYNNYDKSDYRKQAELMLTENAASYTHLNQEDRNKLLSQYRETPKPTIGTVNYNFPDFKELADRTSRLLLETVISKGIETLKNDPKLSQWTRDGLSLHKERNTERCLFCGQPLPNGYLSALDAHFSAEYEDLLRRIDDQIDSILFILKQADKLSIPSRGDIYDFLASDYDEAYQALKEAISTMKQFLNGIHKLLENKKNKIFESLPERIDVPIVDFQSIKRLNEVIRRHNQSCDDFQKYAESARESLAKDMIAESIEEFANLKKEVEQAAKEEQSILKRFQQLKEQIDRLEREIIQHRKPAEDLNTDLKNYLGHDELQLKIKETGYEIARNGVTAEALSEGETTAVALLYFLKSLEDRRFDLKRGVVVLDDPVSSLDANALYLAFGFIRARTKEVGQLFILTHNFLFFRQVRNWFGHLKGQKSKDANKRPARFYMIECAKEQTCRSAYIRWLDPLLEHYDSEYHYLFSRLYKASRSNNKVRLEEYYDLPNMARRLLETFLAFRMPQMAHELGQKMDEVEFDENKKIRIMRFVHTYSHSADMPEPEHDPSLLAEASSVLTDLMGLINKLDREHYSAMVKLVDSGHEIEEEGMND